MEHVLIWIFPAVLAITLHEAAHGYAAHLLGDSTAWNLGRVTLNPLKHIDPMGTILVPGLLILLNYGAASSFPVFGWAKPVPVKFGQLRSPKRDMLWVALAGPAANFVQALIWAVIVGISALSQSASEGVRFFMAMSSVGVMVNLWLMVLNLLPVPPFDGGRILVSLLPMPYALKVSRIEPYGFIILIALLYLKVIDKVLSPIVFFLGKHIFALVGIS